MDYSLDLFSKKKNDYFNIPTKKDESSAYNRGYNAALKKCNQKMKRILSYMALGYNQALRDDDDFY
jgi:hypothetical protein